MDCHINLWLLSNSTGPETFPLSFLQLAINHVEYLLILTSWLRSKELMFFPVSHVKGHQSIIKHKSILSINSAESCP